MQDVGASSLLGDYYAHHETALSIIADTALAVPRLLAAVEERMTDSIRSQADQRMQQLEPRHTEQRRTWQAQAAEQWDDIPISVPRLTMELWELINDDEWVLVSGGFKGWTHKLWKIDSYEQYFGGYSGGAGVGYGIGAAIGGALAYRHSQQIPINLQDDGDLMQFLSGLWTIGHYDIPLFTVIHNNRCLYNSTQHRMRVANYRDRDDSFEQALLGTGIQDPVPDYASIAEAQGVTGYGPVEDPNALSRVLNQAWEKVKEGQPVLVDVITQPR